MDESIEIGIDRVKLNVNQMKSFTNVEKGEAVVRLSRTGKGSISEKRIAHTTKISKLLDNAYEKAREASNY